MTLFNNVKRPLIIAEAGVNHNGSLERAKDLILKAKNAGCDAIKFQTYTADELVVKGTPKFWEWEGDKDRQTQYDAYKAIGGFPYEHYPELIRYCNEVGIEFLSTPFSIEAADKLNEMGVGAFKIASSDLSTIPFLEHVASFGKPMILSTGAATMREIREAVTAIERAGNKEIIILQCTLCYPTELKDLHLGAIKTMGRIFFYPIGLSDHSLGTVSASVAVGAGAMVLEKHFTVDKTLPDSADHWLSLSPLEMFEYVQEANRAFEMMGDPVKSVIACERDTRKYDKRSLVSKVDIPKGTVVRQEMVTFKRPGTGIWPRDFDAIVGRTALEDIKEDTIIQWNQLSTI